MSSIIIDEGTGRSVPLNLFDMGTQSVYVQIKGSVHNKHKEWKGSLEEVGGEVSKRGAGRR